jgi:uncharacterized membrane protein YjjP (DUF1212 family)
MKLLMVDRVLMIALLCAAVSYIMKGTWSEPFFEASAIMVGTVWAVRLILTNRERGLRLMGALMLVLLWSLLAFYLGAAHGLL